MLVDSLADSRRCLVDGRGELPAEILIGRLSGR
jgi:hypothetical protein